MALCFRDMAFCRSDCVNSACDHHFGEQERADAIAWWGSDEAPIAFSDYSLDCAEYQPAQQEPEHG